MSQPDGEVAGENLWINDPELPDQLCVALIEGRSIEDALHGLAPRAVGPIQPAADLARWLDPHPNDGPSRSCIEAFTRGGWVIALDWDGWNATEDKVLLPLSAGTRVSVVYWNLVGNLEFIWAVDGTVVRDISDNPWRVLPSDPLPEEQGLPVEIYDHDDDPPMDYTFLPLSSLMTLMQRLTGVQLKMDDLTYSVPTRLAIPYYSYFPPGSKDPDVSPEGH